MKLGTGLTLRENFAGLALSDTLPLSSVTQGDRRIRQRKTFGRNCDEDEDDCTAAGGVLMVACRSDKTFVM